MDLLIVNLWMNIINKIGDYTSQSCCSAQRQGTSLYKNKMLMLGAKGIPSAQKLIGSNSYGWV